jgi:AraC-like DNA-binding protein
MQSGASLADAAAASGFADQAHMTRQFKKAYGISPGRWQRTTSLLKVGPCATETS